MNFDGNTIFLLTFAAAAGAAAWRLGSLEARVKALEAFRARTGERLGAVEETARLVRRSLTGAHGQPAIEPGGRVQKSIEDASSER